MVQVSFDPVHWVSTQNLRALFSQCSVCNNKWNSQRVRVSTAGQQRENERPRSNRGVTSEKIISGTGRVVVAGSNTASVTTLAVRQDDDGAAESSRKQQPRDHMIAASSSSSAAESWGSQVHADSPVCVYVYMFTRGWEQQTGNRHGFCRLYSCRS